ncbi:MAG: glycine rich domain-containing protein [Proteobacteria bacterium]|nr:glycine rich domain-containing protein [Pseudomonadota bacterium]
MNAYKRLAMPTLMAAFGVSFMACQDDALAPMPGLDLQIHVSVSGNASKDGSETANVTLSVNRNPGGDTYYFIVNHTPDVCVVDPMQIDIDDWQASQSVVVSGLDNGEMGNQDCHFDVIVRDKDGNELASTPGHVQVIGPDAPLPEIEVSVTVRGNASEDGSVKADVHLSMSRDPGSDVTYVIENHTPNVCSIDPSELNIARDDWQDTQTIVVSGIANGMATGDLECLFTIRLYDEDGNELTSTPGVVIVEDQDSPGLHIVGSSGYTSEDGTSTTFDVWLHTLPTASVTVAITSSRTSEGVLIDQSGSVVDRLELAFTTDNWNQKQTVTVKGVPDGVVDGDQDYDILFVTASTDDSYDGYIATRPLINLDIDEPGLSIGDGITSIVVSESGTSVDLPIILAATPIGPVMVSVVSSNTAEAVVSVSELTFTPENWDVAQIVTVTGVPDDIDDGDQPFEIILTPTGSLFDKAGPHIINGINENIDTAGVLITKQNEVPFISMPKGTMTAPLEVVLTSKPTSAVVLSPAVFPNHVARLSENVLIFTPDNWNVPQTTVIHGIAHTLMESLHMGPIPSQFSVVFSALSEDSKYHQIYTSPTLGACVDDDAQSPGNIYNYPQDLRFAPDLLSATFTVAMDGWSRWAGDEITLDIYPGSTGYVDENGIELPPPGFALDKTSLTFTRENWFVPQDVTLTLSAPVADSFGAFKLETGAAGLINVTYDLVRPACDATVILAPGTYQLEVWGAQGGFSGATNPNFTINWMDQEDWSQVIKRWTDSILDTTYRPEIDINRGGYASGILTLTESTKVWLCEGGKGGDGFLPEGMSMDLYLSVVFAGGRNGGGSSNRDYFAGFAGLQGAGGGGGSDIRIGHNSLNHRVIVAGGGGGNNGYFFAEYDPSHTSIISAGVIHIIGGTGGGQVGGYTQIDSTWREDMIGPFESLMIATGGSQIHGGGMRHPDDPPLFFNPGNNSFLSEFAYGSFGIGGNGSRFYNPGAGGGGGWYGGAAGLYLSAGAGGSGYALTEDSHKPFGYVLGSKYYLSHTVVLGGSDTMPAPGGGTQVGHPGDGVARISKCDSAGRNCVVCPGGICPE